MYKNDLSDYGHQQELLHQNILKKRYDSQRAEK